MQTSLKLLLLLFSLVITKLAEPTLHAQVSKELHAEISDNIQANSSSLYWKKLDKSDFLIQKTNQESTVAIVPVRGQFLVKIIAEVEPQFSVSNGSGLFQTTTVKKTNQGHYIFRNQSSGLVWLRLQYTTGQNYTAYIAEPEYYSSVEFLHPLNSRTQASSENTSRFTLSNSRDRVEKIYIDQDKPYSFNIQRAGVLLFRHQIDYELSDSQFDVLYQVAWQGRDQKYTRNYTTRPEVQRLYEAKCLHQLGQRKDTIINIDEPGRYTFTSNQPIQAEFYLLSDQQVLLDRRSKALPFIEKSIDQINIDNEIVNNFNTYIDQNAYQEGLSSLLNSSENQQIFSLLRAKHSFFKPLHPVTLQDQKMLYAYYSIYSEPELPSNKNAEFYLNENLTDDITKKISIGYFYPFSQETNLEYEIASEIFENKLRIAVANVKPNNSSITLSFDTGDEIELAIEHGMLQVNKKLNVVDVGLTILNQNQSGELATLSSEFSSKKPVAPFLNTVTGLIEIPQNATSFKVKSTDDKIWLSIAYPQRSFYREFEYQPIKKSLIDKVSTNNINQFVSVYTLYKSLQRESTTKNKAEYIVNFLTNLESITKEQLQNWTPYYREIFNAEIKSPQQAHSQIKLFSLSELKSIIIELSNNKHFKLRNNTLLAHAYYSPQRQVREYAFNEYTRAALKGERYRQILDLAHVLLIRHADEYVLNHIVNMHQRLDNHKKAIFYISLNPTVVEIDNILASLFYLRQWGLFEELSQQSDNALIWQNLRLYQQTALSEYLGQNELNFVDQLGSSWVDENRFLLNYKNSQLIQSVSTLAIKQVAYINSNNTASLIIKGPLSLRLRVAKESIDNNYTQSKYKLRLNSSNEEQQVFYRSVPAASWLNLSNTVVGTFGSVDLDIADGVQDIILSSPDGPAYVYIESKRNLLGLNLNSEETVDAEFVRENAILYNRKDANKKRTIGYLKSSCRRLRRLQQDSIKTFQAVDIDLSLRDSWIQNQLQLSTQNKNFNHNLFDKLKKSSSNSLTLATQLNNACLYNESYSKNCIDTLHQNMLSGNTASALTLLNYIDKHAEVDLNYFRNEVFDKYEWQLLKSVRQSDGQISLDSEFLQEDNSYINSLKNNFIGENLSSLFITGSKVQGFQFSQEKKDNQLNFKRISQSLVVQEPIIINFQIDDEAIQSFELTQNEITKNFRLEDKQSELKFWLSKETANNYVSIYHQDKDLVRLSKNYFVATPDTPIKLALNGPQRLKVVSQEIDGIRKIQEQEVPVGSKILEFASNSDETYYRFFVLKPSFTEATQKNTKITESEQSRLNLIKQSRVNRLSTSLNTDNTLSIINKEVFNNKKSTYDISLNHGRSLDEEQENTNTRANQFTELQGQYRYYSPDTNFYWSGDAKLRTGDGFTAVFGQARADWVPENSPFEYSAFINDWLFSGDTVDLNAVSAGLSAAYRFNYKYNHTFTTRLSGFYRNSFGDEINASNFNQVQNTIWSPYKENHKFGIQARQRWTYQAFKDTQFYTDARLQTNENPISVDYIEAAIGYRQLYNTATLEASLVNRNFFADDDRDNGFASNRFRLSADWLLQAKQDGAFRVGMSYFNNFSANNSAYTINLSWLYHRGNYLEDYRPGEYRFRQTRERRLLENTFNNLDEQ